MKQLDCTFQRHHSLKLKDQEMPTLKRTDRHNKCMRDARPAPPTETQVCFFCYNECRWDAQGHLSKVWGRGNSLSPLLTSWF